VFVEAGLWGRGVFLPAGDDPDTFVRQQGPDALRDQVEKAEPLVDAYVASLTGTRLDAVGRRAEAARDVARLLKSVQNPFEREALLRLAAYRLGREVLLDAGAPNVPQPTASSARAEHASSAEEQVVELMALDPGLAARVDASGVIAEFEQPELQRLAQGIVDAAGDDGGEPVIERLPRDLRDRVVRRLLEDDHGDREQALADCIAKIRERRSGRTRSAIVETLRAAEARGDVAAARLAEHELNRFLSEKNRT
jgi:DNA primase